MTSEEIRQKRINITRKYAEIYKTIQPQIEEIDKERESLWSLCKHTNIDWDDDDVEECLDCGRRFYE